MLLPIPPDYVKSLTKRWEIVRKGISPPTLKMVLKNTSVVRCCVVYVLCVTPWSVGNQYK